MPPSGRFGSALYGGSLYGINWALADLPGPRWDLIATLPTGEGLADLASASDRKITFRLTEPSTIEWSMRGVDPAATVVDELATDVVAYRNGVRVLRARVGASDDDIDTDTHKVKFSAVDYRGVLARRTLWRTTQQTFTAQDQAAIAWQLIVDTQALTAGDLGISRGLGAVTGHNRDRTYEPGSSLGEALEQLARVQGGFDYDVSPELEFNIWCPGRGVEREFVAHHGATVTKVSRQVDPSTYANAVRQTGATGTTPATREVADLATRTEGRWEAQVGDTDVSVGTTISEKADWLLSERSVIRPAYTCTLAPEAWDGPATLWLGDTCRLVVRSGRLDVDTTARVYEIAVTPGDDGGETVEITFDRPQSSFIRRASRNQARIDQLERR